MRTLLSPGEWAEHHGVTRQTVYNLMKRGMPSRKIGRSRRLDLAETDRWLDADAAAQAAQHQAA